MRLGRRQQGWQGARDARPGVGVVAVQTKVVRPTLPEPLRLTGEEAVVDRRAGDAAVGQRCTVRAQVGATGEASKHGLHLRQHRRVVGVGSDEAQRFVQAHHGARAAESGARELLQQRKLCVRRPGVEFEAVVFQCGKRSQRHGDVIDGSAHELLAAGRSPFNLGIDSKLRGCREAVPRQAQAERRRHGSEIDASRTVRIRVRSAVHLRAQRNRAACR